MQYQVIPDRVGCDSIIAVNITDFGTLEAAYCTYFRPQRTNISVVCRMPKSADWINFANQIFLLTRKDKFNPILFFPNSSSPKETSMYANNWGKQWKYILVSWAWYKHCPNKCKLQKSIILISCRTTQTIGNRIWHIDITCYSLKEFVWYLLNAK